MSSDGQHRANAIFLEACLLEGAARACLLDERCAGDADLRAEVEDLLQLDESRIAKQLLHPWTDRQELMCPRIRVQARRQGSGP